MPGCSQPGPHVPHGCHDGGDSIHRVRDAIAMPKRACPCDATSPGTGRFPLEPTLRHHRSERVAATRNLGTAACVPSQRATVGVDECAQPVSGKRTTQPQGSSSTHAETLMPHRLPTPARYALFTLLLLAGGMATRIGHAADARAPAPTCNQVPAPDCLYFPAARHGHAAYARSTFYSDIGGRQREVRFIDPPADRCTAPMPAVVWLHGGADGKSDPATSMVEWSDATAAAGYFTVSIAHANVRRQPPRPVPVAGHRRRRDLRSLQVPELGPPARHPCGAREIERMNASGEFVGQIDLRRIAVGGHSAGSGGARRWRSQAPVRRAPVDLSDPRPIAFLAFSPQRPGSEGFFDTRFGTPRPLVGRHAASGADRHRRRRQHLQPRAGAGQLHRRHAVRASHRVPAHAGLHNSTSSTCTTPMRSTRCSS